MVPIEKNPKILILLHENCMHKKVAIKRSKETYFFSLNLKITCYNICFDNIFKCNKSNCYKNKYDLYFYVFPHVKNCLSAKTNATLQLDIA